MVEATRKADQRARLVLPDDFANETIVIERIGPNELRLRKKKTLSQLVAGITPENLHGEWDTGPDVGKEVVP
jgi:antitoxin component of MazEF toxin-antitoxin module